MKKKLGLLIIVLLFLVSGSLFSQYARPGSKWNSSWINLGMGAGSGVDIWYPGGMSLAMVANYTTQKGKSILSVRGTLCSPLLDASVTELGLMYGRVITSPGAQVIISAGIAGVQFQHVGGHTNVFGVPLELQIFAKKTHRIGLYGFANINAKKSFCGLCLCLRLGK